jgi:hypothetical protein
MARIKYSGSATIEVVFAGREGDNSDDILDRCLELAQRWSGALSPSNRSDRRAVEVEVRKSISPGPGKRVLPRT